MARKCPKCDAEISSPKVKFCTKCGAVVPPPKQMVLSVIAIVLAALGFFLSFLWGIGFLPGLAALIIGIIAGKREPRGKVLTRLAVGLSIAAMVISIIAIVVGVIFIAIEGSQFDQL